MKINVKEFLQEAEINEAFYPGKRLVHTCKSTGQFKSHCIVLDWRDPAKIRMEVKAGLSGRSLEPQKLKYYPVCFQAPTYVDIEVINDNDEEEETEGNKGKASGGGKQPTKKLDDLKTMASDAFGQVMQGQVPEMGKIIEMVVMGTKIAEDAYGAVMGKLAEQVAHAKIAATDLLAQAGDFVTKYTPPSFMAPKGDEQATYKYDREKNANIGYRKPALG